jgi:alkanesulfonate monooxygenase SsuD/methylene tetrahydromethanopterin reductase-like flavin-dependent oxidoreductase (luciferase family)
MTEVRFGIYVPQLAMDWDGLRQRALWVEELGFDSFWMMDHLYPPGLPTVPSFEGWTAATALLAATSSLRVGHMVLCNNFRSPALLGKMATTLDVISGGRLLLGMGSGSVGLEHVQAGLPWGSFGERTQRLEESLEIVTRMFRGEPVTFDGATVSVRDLPNLPAPITPGGPPIVVGGSGPRTIDLAARYAAMWNCPTYALAETEQAMANLDRACERVGRDPATIVHSTESVLALAATDADLPAVTAAAQRRYGGGGFGLEHGFVGTPDQVVERLRSQVALGIDYFVFFPHDRCTRETLELLAEEVVPHVT